VNTSRVEAAGLLEASALMFVAYTGYGRIATMGEEIRQPERNIPRAIIASLAISALLYVVVAAVLVATTPKAEYESIPGGAVLGPAARAFGFPAGVWWIGLGAILAMLGILLNLVLGVSRVWLAMGRRGDMPRGLARVNKAGTTPVPAVILTGALIAALALAGSIKLAWSFSAFTVLVYYAITNAAALRLPREQRRYPRALAWLGLCGCVFLAFWVQWEVWAAGLGLIAAGLLWHVLAQRLAKNST
jgi:APA family basic amino acid/polyamine antiporter